MCICHRHPEHARYAPLDDQRQETRWAMGSGSWDEKVTRRNVRVGNARRGEKEEEGKIDITSDAWTRRRQRYNCAVALSRKVGS